MTLGLFPLNLVLFPESRIALHIFEPRYKTLINECLERGVEFGINFVDEGHMHTVGCAANVVEVTTTYDDGSMDIIVEGLYRYTLIELEETSKPYAVATVTQLVDDGQSTDMVTLASVQKTYNLIVTMVFGQQAPTFTMDEFSDMPSFQMAPKCGLSDDQKQDLLGMVSENDRLRMLDVHLGQLLPAMRRAEQVQQFIQRDGYIKAIPTAD
ncbi:MAG: LON peptidase substrate-binding domain-containing protein [Ignavibacteria bacterium]